MNGCSSLSSKLFWGNCSDKVVKMLNTSHPLSVTTHPLEGHRGWSQLTLGWGKVHPGQVASLLQGWRIMTKNNSHSHSHLPQVKNQHLWTAGGSWSTRREPTQTQGEHANSPQKGPALELHDLLAVGQQRSPLLCYAVNSHRASVLTDYLKSTT